MKRDDIVCACTGTTVGMIQDAIDGGADSVEKVQEATQAGTVCGACEEDVERLVAALLEEKKK